MTERELRKWHREHSLGGRVGYFVSGLGWAKGGLRFWSADQAAELLSVEQFDRAGDCEAVALAVNRAYGFPVCFGWAASVVNGEEAAFGHCWNLDSSSGKIVDAAKARTKPTGYLGVELEPSDLGVLGLYVPGLATAGQSGGGIPPIGKPSDPQPKNVG